MSDVLAFAGVSVRRGNKLLLDDVTWEVEEGERWVVLGPNGVEEDGSHDELLSAGGEYAAMFRLQASRFAASGSTDEPDGDQSGEHDEVMSQ